MATFVHETTFSGAGVLFPLLSGDALYVTSSGFLQSTNAATVTVTGLSSVFVDGSIWSNGNNSAISGDTTNGMSLDVSATGRVFATTDFDFATVNFQGRASVDNAGRITNTQGHAVIVAGGSTVSNSGIISGGQLGVAYNPGVTGSTLFNSGVISGGNSIGTPVSFAHAVYIGALNTDVFNTGTIISNFDGGHAILILESGAYIENGGQITAARGTAIDASAIAGGVRVLNTGTITGGTFAIAGGAGLDVVTNLGTIATGRLFGEVMSLGGGFDQLTNDGRITGTIFMGADGDSYVGRFSTAGAIVVGQGGNDTLTGGAFGDSLNGGSENDLLTGNGGDDAFLDQTGNDTINGGAGDDLIDDRAGSNQVSGGTGDDVIKGGADTDTIFGGAGDDSISDTAGSNELNGGAGDDSITGGTGSETLVGGLGDDTLIGGAGDDVYGVNSLADVVSEFGQVSTADRVESSAISLDLTRYVGVEHAALTGTGALNVTGSDGSNMLTGNAASNRLTGLAGSDTLLGGGGADVVTGGAGRDSLTGGTGADVFVLVSAAETGLGATTRDTITDFVVGLDDLRMIFMASYIGGAGFTAAGQVRYVAATGLLSGSTDADASSEWTLQLSTGLALTSGDFVF